MTEEIIRLWKQGLPMTQIANEIDVNISYVRSILIDAGFTECASHSEGAKRHYAVEADKKWKEIRADLDAGMKLSAIQKKYGMTKERLSDLFMRQKFDYDAFQKQKQAEADAGLKAQLVTFRNAGKTVKEIANALGKSETTIGRYLLKFKLSNKADRTDIEDDTIRDYWKQGWSMNMIARKLSCSVDTISKRLSGMGIHYERLKQIDVLQDANVIDHSSRVFDDLERLGISYTTDTDFDIWMPDHNIGIEIHPTAISSIDMVSDLNQVSYQKKSLAAEVAGVGLLHLYDSDLIDEHAYQVFLTQIRCMAGQKTKLGARKCSVRQITRQESNAFLLQYHFQGGENASCIGFGLFYQDLLLGVLTVGRPRYAKADYEIIRYCMRPDYIVTGCFQKLFKAFLRTLSSDADILSYMDLNKRMRASSVYESHDFEYLGTTPPDYTWYNRSGSVMRTRYSVMKKNLIAQGFDSSKSEVQIMKEQGFVRVFGAGSKKFMYHYRT